MINLVIADMEITVMETDITTDTTTDITTTATMDITMATTIRLTTEAIQTVAPPMEATGAIATVRQTIHVATCRCHRTISTR